MCLVKTPSAAEIVSFPATAGRYNRHATARLASAVATDSDTAILRDTLWTL